MTKTARKIRVLQIINSLHAGGAEVLLKNFTLHVKKHCKKYNDFNIEVAILYSEDLFQEDIEKAGISIWELGLKFKYDLRGILKLISLIKREKYNIVHVHLFPANLFGSLVSLFLANIIPIIEDGHLKYLKFQIPLFLAAITK